MQSVIKLMPEPIPEVPRDAATTSAQDFADPSGSSTEFGQEFSQEFDNQINQYNQANPQKSDAQADSAEPSQAQAQTDEKSFDSGGSQQAHADFPDDSGNQTPGERQHLTAEQLRELAAKRAEPQIVANDKNTKSEQANKTDTNAGAKVNANSQSSALDALVAMVEKSDKLIRSDQPTASIDTEFMKQNKLTDAMDQTLIGKQGDRRSIGEMLKGFVTSGKEQGQLTDNANGAQTEGDEAITLDKLLGKTASNGDKSAEQHVGEKTAARGETSQLTPAQLLQGKGEGKQANLVINGESQTDSIDQNALDVLKNIRSQTDGDKQASALQGADDIKVTANGDAQSTKNEKGTIDLSAIINGDKAKPKGEIKGEPQQTKPMELAEQKPIKPMELSQDQAAKTDLETLLAGKVESDKGETKPTTSQLVDGEGVKSSLANGEQNIKVKNGVEPANQQLAAQQSTVQQSTVQQSATQQTIAAMSKDAKRQNILGKSTTTKAGVDAQPQATNSEKLAQIAAQEQQNLDAEQNFDDGQGSEGFVDEMLNASLPKDAPVANNKVASQFGQTLNQFSTENVNRLNAATQTLAATGGEKTPPQVTETLQMTRPDLSANMKERVTLMMKNGVQTADIRLDPAELGQMQVKMSVENDVTSVSIVVQNSQAKELLEKALPQLKEMLAEQGVEMGESSVSQQDRQQQELGDDGQHSQGQLAGQGQIEEDENDPTIVQQVNITNGAIGGIDFFA